MIAEKICPICGHAVFGRSDKRFCSSKCRSIDQYEKRQKEEPFFLKVDRQLKINRKILKRYNKSGYATIRKTEIVSKGFNPKFFTHYWKNKQGNVYFFVYEYGFLNIKNNGKDKYLLVKWQSYMDKS
ncbi:DUF2116 family Zn-ribbon domain-containing protein [Zobellia uliginosa]|nr:DUF2116 family Zn-ribbon domain-containing protein [Zobellia uliginosa]